MPGPPPPPAAPVITPLSATVRYAWVFNDRRTRATRLEVRGAPAGATVTVTCRGHRRCPFGRRAVSAKPNSGPVVLTRFFRRRTLGPGTRVEVRVTLPNTTGKVVRFTTRRGNEPRTRFLCLPPGAKRPGRCPS